MNDARPPSRREMIAAAAILMYIVIQVAIPLAHVRYRYHTPFAWKMFAYYRGAPVALRVVLRDGVTHRVPNRPRVAVVLRPEVNRARFRPPALCRQLPEILAVEFRTPDDKGWRRFQCD